MSAARVNGALAKGAAATAVRAVACCSLARHPQKQCATPIYYKYDFHFSRWDRVSLRPGGRDKAPIGRGPVQGQSAALLYHGPRFREQEIKQTYDIYGVCRPTGARAAGRRENWAPSNTWLGTFGPGHTRSSAVNPAQGQLDLIMNLYAGVLTVRARTCRGHWVGSLGDWLRASPSA